jgi:hypothetical protein
MKEANIPRFDIPVSHNINACEGLIQPCICVTAGFYPGRNSGYRVHAQTRIPSKLSQSEIGDTHALYGTKVSRLDNSGLKFMMLCLPSIPSAGLERGFNIDIGYAESLAS